MDAFCKLTLEAGLEFRQVGPDGLLGVWVDHPDAWTPGLPSFTRVVELALQAARPLYEELQALPADLVVSGAIAFGARLAAERDGFRQVTLHLAPGVFQSLYEPPVVPGLEKVPGFARGWLTRTLSDLAADRLAGPRLNALRAELGLPPVRRIFSRWWNSERLILGMFPAWFGPPQADWPAEVQLVGFPRYDAADLEPMTAEAESFLAAGSPPVVFTAGTGATHAEAYFAAAAAACRALGRRGMLLTRQALGEGLGEDVRPFAYLPFSRLLPRCAALVHHGGIGTLSQALAAGIPQLVMPMAHDQHDNAERVHRLGAGRVLPFGKPERLAAELGALLADPGAARAAQECQARVLAEDGIRKGCNLLEGMAG